MNKKRIKEYDILYMNIAERIAKMSHAVRNKVGCVIVKDHNIISYGFNGMPTGFDNICEIEKNGVLETKIEVLHAESNAISKLAKTGLSSKDATVYVTLSPCIECSKLLIQSGINQVFYKEQYRNTDGLQLLKKAGIKVIKL
jgi:dCMP deaminase